jgi:hypothetical protein
MMSHCARCEDTTTPEHNAKSRLRSASLVLRVLYKLSNWMRMNDMGGGVAPHHAIGIAWMPKR